MKKILLISFIVFLLLPVFAFSQETPDECIDCSEPGGMVPCGRKCDDPSTIKDECLPCTLCDFFVMADIMIDSIISGPLVAILILLIIGIMAMTAYARKGAPETVNKIKRALTGVVIGIIIMYSAWVIVYMILLATGAATWSGLDDLWIINCPEYVEPEHPELVQTSCGDGDIQRPNNDDFTEVCDGIDLGGQTCRTRGYGSGDLACLGDCSWFDESDCVPYDTPPAPSLPTPVPMNPEALEIYSVGEEYFMCDCTITIIGWDHSGTAEQCKVRVSYDGGHIIEFETPNHGTTTLQRCWHDIDRAFRLGWNSVYLGPGYTYFGREAGYTARFGIGGYTGIHDDIGKPIRCILLKTIPWSPQIYVVPTGHCGDGIWQALNDDLEVEYCDGDSFPPLGSTCTDYINQPNSRQVVCTSECEIDISPCFAP